MKKRILLGIALFLIVIEFFIFNIYDLKVCVLMYHSISDDIRGGEELFVSPKAFEKQMKYLNKKGFKTLFVEELDNKKITKKNIVITFDDGYEDFYTNVLPILKKYNIKANLYVVTDKIGKKNFLTAKQLKEISDSGLVSIGSHTVSHPELSKLNKKTIEKELVKSKQVLENITKKEIKTISYPNGNYDENVIKIAKKHYEYGLIMNYKTQIVAMLNNYKINRIGIYKNTQHDDFVEIINLAK